MKKHSDLKISTLFLILLCILILSFLITLGFNYFNFKLYKNEDNIMLKFNKYLKDFNKRYSGLEYSRRLQNFKASLAQIAELNALEQDTVYGLTKFSDMSSKEFAEQMLIHPLYREPGDCFKKYDNCSRYAVNEPMVARQYFDKLPDQFDWRDYGVVGRILDQKRCGGCWAFGIVGTMQSMAAIQGVSHQELSIQELLDCSKDNSGCLGGNVRKTMNFLCRERVSIVTAKEYPLTLKDDRDCKVPPNKTGVRVKEYRTECNMPEDELLRTIVHHGPVVVIVNAANWYNYIGNVIRRACVREGQSFDHVVQVVGYNKKAEIPYYIIKNSYGTLFGDHGYVKVAIGSNVCGIVDEVNVINVEYHDENHS